MESQGRGDTLILSYIRRLGSFFGVQNFEFHFFFQKDDIFWGMKILWIFFLGHHKNGLYLRNLLTHTVNNLLQTLNNVKSIQFFVV